MDSAVVSNMRFDQDQIQFQLNDAKSQLIQAETIALQYRQAVLDLEITLNSVGNAIRQQESTELTEELNQVATYGQD